MKNLFRYCEVEAGLVRRENEEFVVKKIGSDTAARQQKLQGEIETFEKNAGIPRWLSIVALVLLALGVGLFSGALDSLTDGDVAYETLVQNGLWWGFGIGLGLLAAGGAIELVAFFRKRSAMASPVCGDLKTRWAHLERESREELLVPETAIPADIITECSARFFKHKFFSCVNSEQYVFCDGPALCLASVSDVVKIPYERIERVERVEKRITFPNWNKQSGASADLMKRYKVKLQNGTYSVKPYYRIVIRGDEPAAVVFPSYEFERLAPLLGSNATNLVTVKK